MGLVGSAPVVVDVPRDTARVLFVDVVDPDNYAAATGFCLQAQARNETAHVVLTGRPCCFRFTRFSPHTMSFRGLDNEEVAIDLKCHVRAQPYELLPENIEPEHSRLLLSRAAWNMRAILSDAGIDLERVAFYDGLVAALGAVSHAVHDYEDMFVDDDGNVLSKDAYFAKLRSLSEMSVEERVWERTQTCKRRSFALRSLETLAKALEATERLQFFLCGPCTAIPVLAEMANINSKPGAVIAMGCSWDGSQNFLGENFNGVADWDAFKKVSVDCTVFPNLNRVFVPTETCKAGTWLRLQPEVVARHLGMPKLAKLVELWTSLKGDRLQPAFDLAVLLPRSCVPFPLHEVSLAIVPSEVTPVKQRCALDVAKENVDEAAWQGAVAGEAPHGRALAFGKDLHGDESLVVPWLAVLREEARDGGRPRRKRGGLAWWWSWS